MSETRGSKANRREPVKSFKELEVHRLAYKTALEDGYVGRPSHERLSDIYDHINARLFKMIQDADSWCLA